MRSAVVGLTLLLMKPLIAEVLVDCRVIIQEVKECRPYPSRMQYLHYKEEERKKRFYATLAPSTEPSHSLEVVSSQSLLNAHLLRYQTILSGLNEVAQTYPHLSLGKEDTNQSTPQEPTPIEGIYRIERGDTLIAIAKRFKMSLEALVRYNQIEDKAMIKVGERLKIPMEQEEIDARASGSYKVKKGETLIAIAKRFDLSLRAILDFNHIIDTRTIRVGRLLYLPFPHILKAYEAEIKEAKREGRAPNLDMRPLGKRSLRVTATAYTSHRNQTDNTPFIAAWNNRIRPGMKMIAVSRDLLRYRGIRNGAKVRISGLPGYYRVKDKMNKRYKRRIDIYMGLNKRKALRWGRRSVTIYW
jgi:LysM repeat protein/3D (Asp-Asp-Asp) domain-containing protein